MTKRSLGLGSGHSGYTKKQFFIADTHQSITKNEGERTAGQNEPIQIPEYLAEELQGLEEKTRNLLENMMNILTNSNYSFEKKLVAIGPMLSELVAILNRLLSVLIKLGLEYIEENVELTKKILEPLLKLTSFEKEETILNLNRLRNKLLSGLVTPKENKTEEELAEGELVKIIEPHHFSKTGEIDPNRLTDHQEMIVAITCLIHMGQGSQIPEFEEQLKSANSIEDILALITQIEEIVIFLSAIKEYSTNKASINLINYIIGNYSRILQKAKRLKNTEQDQLAETNNLESFNRLVKELENRFEALASSLTKYSRQAKNKTIPHSFFLKILDRILQTYEEPLIELMQQIRDKYKKITTASRVNQDLVNSYSQALRICDQITFLLYGEEGMLTLIRNRISEVDSLLKEDPNATSVSLKKIENLIQEIEKRLPRLTAQLEDKDQICRLRQVYKNLLDNLKNRLNRLESTEPT